MFTGNPGHLRSFGYTGPYRYFLTFCTNLRRHLFTSRDRVDLVLMQIVRSAAEERFAIVAYCFMPDHIHLLIEGQSNSSDCRRFISRAKQFSGFHYSRAFGHRLWQRYGVERVLRSEETTLQAARYVLENPLRAGLVKHVEEYPFLGSTTHAIGEILAAAPDARSRSG